MRRYAVVNNCSSGESTIVYRDDTDAPNIWYVMQEGLYPDNAMIFMNALNRESGL